MSTAAVKFRQIWEDPPGLAGWLSTVDHKRIGRRYLVTAFAFLLIGGILALLMRTQLSQPNLSLLSPEAYDEAFSMHGTTMIFLFAMPMNAGFGNYLIPLMIGARDMAFPRLNAFSYWIFLLSGIFMYSSFLIGTAPNAGWYAYAPLTESAYSPGLNMDFWTLGLIFLGTSTTAGVINFIATIFKLRAPGMSLNRMPLYVWAVMVMSFMVIFALPALTGACALLFLDRRLGMHFFDPIGGGNPVLWQHFFWFFGHPDVYILFLPPIGVISMILPVFSRRPIIGYVFLAMAAVAIGFVSFGVWVHHMFATGLALLEMSYFTAASLTIPIPSGIQVFSWVATIWTGRAIRKTPFLFAVGFIVLFVIGGVTGVMQAVVPFDWQVNHSYWVVAHFHYTLVGTVVFPLFGGFYYWLPKITGRMLDEWLGKLSFWLMFIGFNMTFLQLHLVGLLGAPRRIYTYQSGLGWDPYFLIATIGAFILAFGILLSIWNFIQSLRRGRPAGNNPWDANTLEWGTSSPPQPYNFLQIPTVRSRDPLWEQTDRNTDSGTQDDGQPAVSAPMPPGRETPITTLVDAKPQAMMRVPGPSYWPLILAASLGLAFVGMLAGLPAVIGLGALAAVGAAVGWLFPTDVFYMGRTSSEQGG